MIPFVSLRYEWKNDMNILESLYNVHIFFFFHSYPNETKEINNQFLNKHNILMAK